MTIIQISQLIISLSVIFVWTVRYKNVQKEFELFGIKKIIKPEFKLSFIANGVIIN